MAKAGLFTTADLEPFRVVAQDTLTLVQGGQQAKAVARITDLETGWDDAQATLQAKDPKEWTVLDGDIDAVLKSIRATTPDPATETATLKTFLAVLA